MPRGTTRIRDLILGLFFFGALLGLGWMTTQLRNVPGVGGREYVNVLFEDVYGIRREDPVQVFGTRFGRVSRVEPVARDAWNATGRGMIGDGERKFLPNVLVELELERPLELHEGYRVRAEDSNLLGGKVMTIDPGDPEAPLTDRGVAEKEIDAGDAEALRLVALYGYKKPASLHALGDLVQENQGKFSELIENLRVASESLDDADAKGILGFLLSNQEARRQVQEFVDAAHRLAVNSGQSGNIVNDLFYGSPLRDKVHATVNDISTFASKANDPNSLIGALVAADAPYKQRLDSISADLEGLAKDARRPDNLLSKLLDDSPGSLGDDADVIMDGIREFVDQTRTNRDSLLHEAIYGSLGKSLRSAADQIDRQVASIGDAITNQTGLLGYIVHNPESRTDVERLIKATLGIIEDAREAAPVTSLGSFIFGGF